MNTREPSPCVSTEEIYINLREDGTVVEISKKKIGAFENVSLSGTIDEQALQQKCFEKLKVQLATQASQRGGEVKSPVTIVKTYIDIRDDQEYLGYYPHSPEIKNGQMSILIVCWPYFTKGTPLRSASTAVSAEGIFSDVSNTSGA